LSSNGIVGKDLNVYGSISSSNNIFSNNLYLSSNGIVGKDLTVYGSTSTVNNLFSNNLYLSSNGIVGKDLTVYGSISSSNDIFSNNLYLSSNGIVGKDLNVYGSISSSNNIFSNNFYGNDLYLSGSSIIKNNLTIQGNVSVGGVFLFPPPTIGFASSALYLENNGLSLVFRATQLGTYGNSDIADFRNSSTSVLYVSTGGVGIFNQTPSHELDVNGNIAASNEFIYNSTERPDLTGVKQALDELLYVNPLINSLTVTGGNTLEVGQTLTTPNIAWSSNKTLNSFVLTLPDGSTQSGSSTFLTYADSNSYTVTTSTSSRTWSVIGTDWKAATTSRSTTVNWLYKIYAGGILLSNPDSNDILTNTDQSSFATNRTALGSKTYVMNNEYWFVAYPISFGTTSQLKVNGLNFTDLASVYTIVSFTNANEGTTDYYFYRTNNKITGSYTIEVL
jgi:hypothetical protein